MERAKKVIIVVLVIAVLVFAGIFFRNDLADLYYKFGLALSQIEKLKANDLIKEVEKRVSTPPPLRKDKEEPGAKLSIKGIIDWTNQQRLANGLPALAENASLNQAASIKAQDMFNLQYFAHESPSGAGPAELAAMVSYEFIAVGENLALGNFISDQEVVQLWMDSPGHRANILSSVYTEIGVAVLEGTFEGKKTWMAVQEFGKPLDACPSIDEALKTRIENMQSELKDLENELAVKKREIDRIRPKTSPAYSQAVNEYNSLVNEYNTLSAEIKSLILVYNSQVRAFNECVR